MELSVIATAIRRGLWLSLILAAVGGFVVPRVSRAGEVDTNRVSMEILVQPFGDDASADVDRSTDARLALLTSVEILESAAANANEQGLTAEELRRSVDVERSSDSPLAQITVSGPDIATATVRAETLFSAFVDGLAARGRQPLDARLATIDAELEEVEADLAAAETVLAADPSDGAAVAARQSLIARYAVMLEGQSALENQAARVRPEVSLLARPAPPVVDEPNTLLLLAAGALGGFVLGTLLSLLRIGLSPNVSDVEEAESALDRKISIHLPAGQISPGAVLDDPDGQYAQGIAEIAALAELARANHSLVVAVGSAAPRTRNASTATALAALFSSSGRSTVLADGNPRSPTVGSLFRVSVRSGTVDRETDLLVEPMTQCNTSVTSVAEIVACTRQHEDVVVVNVGTLTQSVSGIEICRGADVIVLLVPMRRQRTDALTWIRENLSPSIGIPIVPVTFDEALLRRWR